MIAQTVARLIKTLSAPEKRFFKAYSNRFPGPKEYLDLFVLIDKFPLTESAAVKENFIRLYPGSSLDNAARYLLKILTDCLVQTRTEKDTFFELLQGIMRAKILQERSLTDEGMGQLKKIRKLATDTQQHFIEYLTYRDELDHFSDTNFQGVNDKVLIATQMKARDILKNLNHIHDHHALFETLKFRLVHSGKISSEQEKKKLNDLMLSEMILVSNKSKNVFAAQKLHLLFQSFFFTDIGDYQSAFKTFNALNNLFEQNQRLLDTPPLDYLSALNGIVESLHMLGKFGEISFYSDKINNLDRPDYPEYFRFMVRKALIINRFYRLSENADPREMQDFVSAIDQTVLYGYRMVDEEKQWELSFYCSLAYFLNRNWKKAHALIDEMMLNHKPQAHSLACKAMRLLNIIIYFEKGDGGYLEYEIRSYKRFFSKHGPLLACEKLILKQVTLTINRKAKMLPEAESRKIRMQMIGIRKDKYERQLLRYFDFTNWFLHRFNIQP